MKTLLLASAVSLALVGGAHAAEPSGTYAFDKEGAHQFINFRISHLGYSWLYGRFNDFDGQFVYDAQNPENSSVTVTIDTTSVDSNHAERDKHIRGQKFLATGEYPQATFKSTGVRLDDDGEADIVGELTLHGVTREVILETEMINHGASPWGDYRMGFEAETEIRLTDFGIENTLGEASEVVRLEISVEGIRQ